MWYDDCFNRSYNTKGLLDFSGPSPETILLQQKLLENQKKLEELKNARQEEIEKRLTRLEGAVFGDGKGITW